MNNCEQITPNKITKLSTIRLIVRVSALLRIIENYLYIMELWNECLVDKNLTTEVKSWVIGCQSQMAKFDLFFGLHLLRCLYSHTDNLSKSLQCKKMSAASSKWLASLTISLFQSPGVEESFKSFYSVVLKKKKTKRIAIYFRAKITPQMSGIWLFYY